MNDDLNGKKKKLKNESKKAPNFEIIDYQNNIIVHISCGHIFNGLSKTKSPTVNPKHDRKKSTVGSSIRQLHCYEKRKKEEDLENKPITLITG